MPRVPDAAENRSLPLNAPASRTTSDVLLLRVTTTPETGIVLVVYVPTAPDVQHAVKMSFALKVPTMLNTTGELEDAVTMDAVGAVVEEEKVPSVPEVVEILSPALNVPGFSVPTPPKYDSEDLF